MIAGLALLAGLGLLIALGLGLIALLPAALGDAVGSEDMR